MKRWFDEPPWSGYGLLARVWRRWRTPSLWAATSSLGAATVPFASEHGLTVSRGPYLGLRYPEDAVGHIGYLAPKLLGSYETELTDALDRDADTFIDIGAGEGYHAVGWATRHPGRVIAYESNSHERKLCRRLAALNGVANQVETRGRFTPDELSRLPRSNCLFLLDVEGYEEALTAEPTPYREATLVIEVHGRFDPGRPERVVSQLSRSHSVERIEMVPRRPEDWGVTDPRLTFERPADAGETDCWILCVPRHGQAGQQA
jgi:hypothetical protein